MNTVLVVAAHADDEVLGCGGTIARRAAEGDRISILILGDGESSRASSERRLSSAIKQRRLAAQRAAKLLGAHRLFTNAFLDNQFDGMPLLKLTKAVEKVKAIVRPEIVYTHHAGDLNVDHRLTLQAVLTACRPQPQESVREIYSFEVSSSTEWNAPHPSLTFIPNVYVNIDRHMKDKLAALEIYKREMRPFPHARSNEAVRALAAWRGATVGFRAAEAFVAQRILTR